MSGFMRSVSVVDAVLRANLLSTVATDSVGHIASGDGAAATTAGAKLRETIGKTECGLVGDGATNEYVAMATTLVKCAGKKLRLSAGNYRIEFTGASAMTPLANFEIEGDGMGMTTITFVPSSDTFRTLFNLSAGGLTLRRLKIAVQAPAGGQVAIFGVASSGLTIDECDIDGGVTNVGAALSHSAYGFKMADAGTHNDITVRNSILRRMTYPWLKTNAATSEQRRVKILDNHFHSNFYNDMGINSPSGVCDDVIIKGNSFRNNLSISAGLTTQALGVALASVTNFRVLGNNFADDYTDAMHFEEGCYRGTVKGNVAYVNGSAMSISGNNIGGVIKTPTALSIQGNTLIKAGVQQEGGTDGIGIIPNASLHKALLYSDIGSNTIIGFEDGIFDWSLQGDGVTIHDNNVSGCANGIKFREGRATTKNNFTKDCTVGVYGEGGTSSFEGGCIDAHTFMNCTTNVDSVDMPVTLLNPTFIFDTFDHVGGNTSVYKTCVALAADDRVHGHMELNLDCSNILTYSKVRDEVTWDGVTFTRANKIAINPGSVVVSASRNASALAVNVFAALARTGLRLTAKLNGMAVIAI